MRYITIIQTILSDKLILNVLDISPKYYGVYPIYGNDSIQNIEFYSHFPVFEPGLRGKNLKLGNNYFLRDQNTTGYIVNIQNDNPRKLAADIQLALNKVFRGRTRIIILP